MRQPERRVVDLVAREHAALIGGGVQRLLRRERRQAHERDAPCGHANASARHSVRQAERRDPDGQHAGFQEHEVPVGRSRHGRADDGQAGRREDRKGRPRGGARRLWRAEEDVERSEAARVISRQSAQAQPGPCADDADRERGGDERGGGAMHPERGSHQAHEGEGERRRERQEHGAVLHRGASRGQPSNRGDDQERRAGDPQVIDETPCEAGREPLGEQVGFESARHRDGGKRGVERRHQERGGHGDGEQASFFCFWRRGRRV